MNNREQMSRIKFMLCNINEVVLFQILEMDERFRNNSDTYPHEYEACNGMVICSVNAPVLYSGKVSLRGAMKKFDLRTATIAFSSETSAREYLAEVLVALEDWAENWEGFNRELEETTQKPKYKVYEIWKRLTGK